MSNHTIKEPWANATQKICNIYSQYGNCSKWPLGVHMPWPEWRTTTTKTMHFWQSRIRRIRFKENICERLLVFEIMDADYICIWANNIPIFILCYCFKRWGRFIKHILNCIVPPKVTCNSRTKIVYLRVHTLIAYPFQMHKTRGTHIACVWMTMCRYVSVILIQSHVPAFSFNERHSAPGMFYANAARKMSNFFFFFAKKNVFHIIWCCCVGAAGSICWSSLCVMFGLFNGSLSAFSQRARLPLMDA